MVAQQRILSIIPAHGWIAVYELGSADVTDLRTKPLVCWALVEDASGTRVVGMDADYVAGQRESGSFLGYARETDPLDRFKKGGRIG